MVGDILNCPRCLARLRLATCLDPGTAVACPRCQTQFVVPEGASGRCEVAGPETRAHVYDPARPRVFVPPRPSREEDSVDEDYPERPRHPGKAVNLHFRVACALHGLAILGALGAAFLEVRTILVGGPLICLLGLYVAALGLKRSFRLATAVGLSALGFSLFVMLLISGLGWGPDRAHEPVRLMGSIYAAASAPLLALVALAPWLFESARADPTAPQCD